MKAFPQVEVGVACPSTLVRVEERVTVGLEKVKHGELSVTVSEVGGG
jgi:hypothetical protein